MITLDDTDQAFVADVLSAAIATFRVRMADPKVCEENRERAREHHKMAIKARDVILQAKKGGEA